MNCLLFLGSLFEDEGTVVRPSLGKLSLQSDFHPYGLLQKQVQNANVITTLIRPKMVFEIYLPHASSLRAFQATVALALA